MLKRLPLLAIGLIASPSALAFVNTLADGDVIGGSNPAYSQDFNSNTPSQGSVSTSTDNFYGDASSYALCGTLRAAAHLGSNMLGWQANARGYYNDSITVTGSGPVTLRFTIVTEGSLDANSNHA